MTDNRPEIRKSLDSSDFPGAEVTPSLQRWRLDPGQGNVMRPLSERSREIFFPRFSPDSIYSALFNLFLFVFAGAAKYLFVSFT